MVPILHRWACELIDLASVAEPAKTSRARQNPAGLPSDEAQTDLLS